VRHVGRLDIGTEHPTEERSDVLQKCAGRWGWFWRPKLGSEKRNGCQPCPEAGHASPIQTIPTSVRSQRERPENRRCSTVVPRRFDRHGSDRPEGEGTGSCAVSRP
jgi:hypothetical protein